jgi:23S rRNA (adenine2503-C2)-methyltransferase
MLLSALRPSSRVAARRAALQLARCSAYGAGEVQPLPRAADGRVALLGLRQPQLAAWLVSLGERPGRSGQVFANLYRQAAGAPCEDELAAADGALAAAFVSRLAALADVSGDVTLSGVVAAADGTRKLLFALRGGGTVEAVLIPARNGSRTTLCISSQLGCAQNCQFCATGTMGLRKNLSAAQIVGQVLAAKRLLAAEARASAPAPPPTPPLENVVFMGMGEPLHNLDEVLTAADILMDGAGFALSRHRVTVSTSGLVPEIRRFAAESRAALAVSLNATSDDVRSWIMPINRKHNLATLTTALRDLFGPASALEHRRRDSVFLEYVLLAGVNDSDADAARLVEIAASLPCKVNMIAYNTVPGIPFEPAPRDRLLHFRDVLARGGITATIRESRGDDKSAACGQLGKADEEALWRAPPPRLKPPPSVALTV